MEKNCLVTKYKASVNDNSLLKIGEMRFDSDIHESNIEKYITFNSYPAVIETLDGSNSLSFDNTFATGLTNKIVFNTGRVFYVKDLNVLLRIYDKYNVLGINCKGFIVNLDDLKYCSNLLEIIANFSGSLESIKTLPIKKLSGTCKQSNNISSLSALTGLTNLSLSETNILGDISSISGLTNLKQLSLRETNISGNISSISGLTNLDYLYLLNNNALSGDISSLSGLNSLTKFAVTYSNISGNISSLSGLINLTDIALENNKIQGNISSLSGLTNFINIDLNNTLVTGDISSLSGLTNLKTLMAINCSISGDISSFGGLTNFTFFNCTNTQLSGEIIDYVIAQRSHGRSTGKTNFNVPMSVTFNGQGVTNANISWTASTITNETTSETVNR